jgi:hypothetical protein
MDSSGQKQTFFSRQRQLWVLTALLWLATAGLGMLAFVALQDLAILAGALVIAQSGDVGTVEARGWITTVRNVTVMLSGLIWLAVVVGGMEYHFRRIGQRRSYQIFAWTLGIELALILAGVFLA